MAQEQEFGRVVGTLPQPESIRAVIRASDAPVQERVLGTIEGPNSDTVVDSPMVEEEKSLRERYVEPSYRMMFDAPEAITKPATKFAESMSQPDLATAESQLQIPTLIPGLSVTPAQLQGFTGGVVEGAASLLSPANILTLGRGRLPQLAARILGGAELAHGGHEIATGNVAEGVGDIAFGALDIGSSLPRISSAPKAEASRVGLERTSEPVPGINFDESTNTLKVIPEEESARLLDEATQGMMTERADRRDSGLATSDSLSAFSPETLRSMGIEPVPPVDPVKKLKEALEKAKPLNEQQAHIYHRERQQRVAKMQEVTETGRAGHYARKGKLAGEYEKVEIEPLSSYLDDADVDELINKIQANRKLLDFEKLHAEEGLLKLTTGRVPQPSEIREMIKVFGEDFAEVLIKVGERSKAAPGVFSRTQNFMRSLLTSFDFSAPGRQGRSFWTRSEYWKAFPAMFRAWGNETAYKNIMGSIMEHPNFKRLQDAEGNLHPSLAERAGLSITDLLTKREEVFRSRLAEKVPVVVRSERAYLAYLNKLRSDVFNSMVDLAKANGKEPEKNDVLLKQIGDLINDATGRGNLGSLEPHASLLNNTFFAPRLHAGRIRMWARVFNPRFYTQTDPMVRREALRVLISNAGLGLMLGEIARMGGAEVSNDPSNTDFRKIKFGDTRIDPFSGDQQYAVAAARLLSGSTTSSTSGRNTSLWSGRLGQRTSGDIAKDFLVNRTAPGVKFVHDIMFDQRFNRESLPEHVRNQMVESVTPIVMQDLYELAKEDPALTPLIVPALLGVGVQTYGR